MISQAIRSIEITLLALILTLAGCATPADRFHRGAAKRGLELTAQGPLFVYRKGELRDGEAIHVYLDGDGTPALHGRFVTRDPSPRDHVVLDLMEVDTAASILVGRPCYYGADANVCDPVLWTSARYSAQVVEILTRTINALTEPYPLSRVTLIGYSGGGTLAMLIAPGINNLDVLITIAANLDTQAWIEHHGYSPLTASLNPADQLPLSAAIAQLHLFGGEDSNVPAGLMRRVVARQHDAVIRVVPGFGHRCCWKDIWTETLEALADHR